MRRPLLAALIATTVALAQPAASEDPMRVGPLAISGAHALETPPNARSAGGYLTIENTGQNDDLLLSAATDRATVQLHKSETGADGVARMSHQKDGIPIPAGSTVTLAPGGLHMMFTDFSAPFTGGESVLVTLRFRTAGEVVVELPVIRRGQRPATGGHGHSG